MRATRDFLVAVIAVLLLLGMTALAGLAEVASPLPGTVWIESPHSFDELVKRLEEAVKASGFAVVTRASASAGAASRGIKIPGNLVIGVFRNDYAVRMLEASVPAGIEAPLRFYVTENPDGTATLTYRKPSAVFAPMRCRLSMPWRLSSIPSGTGLQGKRPANRSPAEKIGEDT